jgi:ethanolamine ammonia-lyase large subunit
MIDRRRFLGTLAAASLPGWRTASADSTLDDLFRHLNRTHGRFDAVAYKQLLGAANPFKEGDAIVGVAAADDAARKRARALLSATTLGDLDAHPLLEDDLYRSLVGSLDVAVQSQVSRWTFGELKAFLLTREEAAIKAIMPGLSSDVIGCIVKLMSDAELIAVGAKLFNPLPGSQIGAKGYLGARIQPNSPTDNVDDIRWQVLDGWSYAVGDVVLGNNPGVERSRIGRGD